MSLNKGIIIAGVCITIVVIGSAVGGAILAANIQSNNDPVTSKVEETKKLNGWQQKGSDWFYYKDDTTQTGWLENEGKWYYLGTDGKMRSGWVQDQGNWYYLNSDGTMASNTTIDGCYLNEKGIWIDTPASKSKQAESESNASNTDQFTYTKAIEIAKDGYSSDTSGIDFSSSSDSYGYDDSGRKYYLVHLASRKLRASGGTGTIDNLRVFADGTILSGDGKIIASGSSNKSAISQKEALNLIYQNDGNNIKKNNNILEYYSVASKDEMYKKRNIYQGANINEEAYVFAAKFKDDPNIEPCLYYVGKESGRIFFEANNGGGSLKEMKNNTVVHSYKWIAN